MEHDDTVMPRYRRGVRQINEREQTMRTKTDDELRAMRDELKARLMPCAQTAKRKTHLTLVPESGKPPS